ncbi:GtrA family protein [Sphingobacterium lactis]|uniref:Putative flippase GtrA (Transmembrane translocase of bactoprenol-linked glucose) n=2 Tax=Sphingobacterium lactis TaxID=797291 RepID=A0A1H6AQ64_9SPHI|nr:GtrA family protein [Sphingobacterium lactis]SEG50522.1 Putative flippase GtrA (transmembrane translocase of bactoprenol-linked glucose) [Sphingobacterium lactis]
MNAKVREFLRAQLSAFVGGLSDFGIYTFCYTALKLTAPLSNVISGSLGAVVNFTINRYWSFKSSEMPIGSQLWKFIVVVLCSIGLKTLGVHIFVDKLHWHFLIGKLLIEIVVSLGFNFTMQKYWVFRKER